MLNCLIAEVDIMFTWALTCFPTSPQELPVTLYQERARPSQYLHRDLGFLRCYLGRMNDAAQGLTVVWDRSEPVG